MATQATTGIHCGIARCLASAALLALVASGVEAQPFGGTMRRVAQNPSVDMKSLLAADAAEATTLVPFGPRLVAGQGPHPSNKTVVRVFDRHGVMENQFLAFPAFITGGVQVEAGSFFPPGVQVAAVPIGSDSTREVRLFHQDGRLAAAFQADASLTPPLLIAAGDFLPQHPGDEIAVTSRTASATSRDLFFHNGAGEQLARLAAPFAHTGTDTAVHLARVPEQPADLLVVQYVGDNLGAVVEPWRGLQRNLNLSNLPPGTRLHPSANAGEYLVGGGEEPFFSTLQRLGFLGATSSVDAGWRENRFWIDPVDDSGVTAQGLVSTFDSWQEGWTQTSSACTTSHADGSLVIRYLNATPFDPYVFGPSTPLDAGQFTQLALRIDVAGGPFGNINGTFYYVPEAGGVGAIPFTFFAGIGPQVVRLDLPALAPGGTPWDGTISRVRLDIPDAGGTFAAYQNAEARIDWVAITADPAFEPVQGQNVLFSDYVRPMDFRHIRTDASSDNYAPPVDFATEDPADWIGPAFQAWKATSLASYYSGPESVWEPTFSHRQFQQSFTDWREAIDAATGMPRYIALTRLDNPDVFEEIGSFFDTMTWSPGLPELERLLVWPLRAYLRDLAPLFRQDPSKMVALEPNHEFEINIERDDSRGDYNPAMIEGFRSWLFARHTTLSKINSRMGTSFASRAAIDPPRNTGRGAWDTYSTSNTYHQAWIDYQRSIVNWRIAIGMRDALLAGFPPEIIKTHQIPASYAVGDAATTGRITPIDWAMTTGTGFGSTRYGIWYNRADNWVQGAFASGHAMIGCGEYHPLTTNQANATAQLRYMFDNGVHFIHHMTWDNAAFNAVGEQAYRSLTAEDRPRPGVTGGLHGVRPVVHDFGGEEQRYNIVQIGGSDTTAGLLKSLRPDGRWEGTVYLTPFHQAINITALHDEESRVLSSTQNVTPQVTGLFAGDQVEVRFLARTDDANGAMTILGLHDGIEFGGTRTIVPLTSDWTSHRFVLAVQERMDAIQLILNSGERDTPTGSQQSIELEQFSILVHKLAAARHEYGITSGTPHRGGVTFDVLSPEHEPASTGVSRFPSASPSAWQIN